MFYVYVLHSESDAGLYIGFSSDLRRRLREHQAGMAPATAQRGPWRLLYDEASVEEAEARGREEFLKSGSGRTYLKKQCPGALQPASPCAPLRAPAQPPHSPAARGVALEFRLISSPSLWSCAGSVEADGVARGVSSGDGEPNETAVQPNASSVGADGAEVEPNAAAVAPNGVKVEPAGAEVGPNCIEVAPD